MDIVKVAINEKMDIFDLICHIAFDQPLKLLIYLVVRGVNLQAITKLE